MRSKIVSIPFRAVTGFEPTYPVVTEETGNLFQSLSGLSLGLNDLKMAFMRVINVSIPFRAVTGFERRFAGVVAAIAMFQSLSGLSLGLNPKYNWSPKDWTSFNPFQGCHWV